MNICDEESVVLVALSARTEKSQKPHDSVPLVYRAIHLKPSARFRFGGEVPAVDQTPRLRPVRPRNSGAWIV